MVVLALWTIYDHPSDYPDHYVARKWLVEREGEKATDQYLMHTSLEGLRAQLPVGLYCLPRQELDDPVIVETWV